MSTLVVTDWGGALLLTDIGRDKRVARLVICPSEAFDNFPPGFPGKVAWLASRNTATVMAGDAPAQDRLAAQAVADVRPDVEKACATGHRGRMAGCRAGRQEDPSRPGQVCRSKFDGKDLIRATNRLAEFDGQVLVLWSRNPVMPAEHGERLAALLPRGQLRQVDDANVLIMTDQPEQTAQAIAEFLTR